VTLAAKFLVFCKLQPRSWGDQYIVDLQPKSWGPVSPGPYGCCSYVYNVHVQITITSYISEM